MQRFIIEQKITMMANQYRVYPADDAGDKQEQVGFAHQKRFAFKEKFEVYTSDDKSAVLFTVQARNVIDLGGRYDVRDADGKLLGVLGKAFKSSLLRSTWQIFAADQEEKPVAIARERNKALAIFRRLWEFLPYLSDIPFFVKYHFDFVNPETQDSLGSFEKTTRFRDYYLLTAEDGLLEKSDWRVLVALGIMLDALQSR